MQNTRKFSSLIGIVALALPLSAPVFATTLDLKVLVISTGTAEEDQGLDVIDDMLDEVGVAYEVLDASRQTLHSQYLADGSHGKFNGIILTDSMLYYTGGGNYLNSAFTLEEWQALHQYERDFGVRESVISGYPASGAYFKTVYDLDYGMDLNTLVAGKSFQGKWQAPAGNTELFEYVNTSNSLPVTDYAVAVEPLAGIQDPQVAPLLKDGDSGRTLVSKLTYADGREVLYSSITNAWYLIHSQLLNYEFLNFATKGLFLGSRKVYLAAHVDDLFLADDLWDPVANATTEEVTYRNSSHDIDNLVLSQKALLQRFKTLKQFKLDMVFNGGGAVALPAHTRQYSPWKDAELSKEKKKGKGKQGSEETATLGGKKKKESQYIVKFILDEPYQVSARKAILRLNGPRKDATQAQVCRVSEGPWVESEVSWDDRLKKTKWTGKEGAVYDPSSCVSYIQKEGVGLADLTPIVNLWLSGAAANRGVVIVGGDEAEVYTREYKVVDARPQLQVEYPETTTDPLTAAVMEHQFEFRFISHTLSHMDMYQSAGTTYEQAYKEIAGNFDVWKTLGLPELTQNRGVLVTGNHSGLDDTLGTELDPSDDIPYPQGRNQAFIRAAQDAGIRYLASDSSRKNQNFEDYVPGTGNQVILLPRYPTSMFYNATNPLELEDEYNYIFFERHVEEGLDPCAIPGAICAPRSYQQILDAEADTTLRHMLTYRTWPHYFHISNLRDYGNGKTLQFDWLNAVMARYESLLKLPVINDAYYDIGERTRRRIEARGVHIDAIYDTQTGQVTLSANRPVVIEATGLANGLHYGGQSQQVLQIDKTPRSIATDLGTTY